MRVASPDGLKRWTAFLDLCALLAPAPRVPASSLHDMDWQLIVGLASTHLASPAIWRAVASGGVPEEVKAYFMAIHEMSARRNRMILGRLADLLTRFADCGIKSVLLKGVASIVSGLYDDPAERILTDIDVLISPGQVGAAERALRSAGYKDAAPIPAAPRRWARPPPSVGYHLPPLVPPAGGVGIELHTSLGPKHLSRQLDLMLPPAGILERAVVAQWRGRTVFVPHPTDFLIHNIVHSQLHHRLFSRGSIELRQMRELAMLAGRNRDAVDWNEVVRRFSAAGCSPMLAWQAALSEALMGVVLPVGREGVEAAMYRLRQGVVGHRAEVDRLRMVGRLARIYLLGFVRDPRLAINLLNPFWWPGRIRGLRRLLRPDKP